MKRFDIEEIGSRIILRGIEILVGLLIVVAVISAIIHIVSGGLPW